jgi:hypothetical protein
VEGVGAAFSDSGAAAAPLSSMEFKGSPRSGVSREVWVDTLRTQATRGTRGCRECRTCWGAAPSVTDLTAVATAPTYISFLYCDIGTVFFFFFCTTGSVDPLGLMP